MNAIGKAGIDRGNHFEGESLYGLLLLFTYYWFLLPNFWPRN